MFALRPYQPTDAPALLALFKATIRRINSRDYGPSRIQAWASDEIDIEVWTKRFEGRHVVVAVEQTQQIGFTELEPSGHIDRFYVSADHQGQGVGRALMNAILAEAQQKQIAKIFAEVSITALPFFKSQGFVVLAQQVVTNRGVEFVNYRMERVLG